MTDEPENESKPEDEGETLLEVGGVVNLPEHASTIPDAPGETLLEIGQPSIYCDTDLARDLQVNASTDAPTQPMSQAETRRVAAAHGGIGGRRYEVRDEIGRASCRERV